MLGIFVILMVMISWVFTYRKTYQVICFKYEEFITFNRISVKLLESIFEIQKNKMNKN